ASIQVACGRGLRAFTPDQFRLSDFSRAESFDSILAAHVLEHMARPEGVDLLKDYVFLVKPGGRLILIKPQESGFKRDPTHVEFLDFDALRSIAASAGFGVQVKAYSFPFPRALGRVFKHNEFVGVYKRS